MPSTTRSSRRRRRRPASPQAQRSSSRPSLDNGSASSIEKLFTSKGGKAIDYDRQVSGGTASVYVTFDGKAVGQAQANGVIKGMKARGTYPGGTVAELWGGQTDQNAFWFKSGNDAVFNRLFKSGQLKKGPQQFVPDWDANNAATIFSQMLVKTSNKIQGVLAANDNIAGAVIADLKAKHLSPLPLSGQDASVQGVQNIISGWQTGTVYKYVPAEANAAAAAAVALIKGKKPKTNGYRMNGKKKEPTLALPVIWITKANYKRLFTDKFLKKTTSASARTSSTASRITHVSAVEAPLGAPPPRVNDDERRPHYSNSAASRRPSDRSRR